jgi:hypothetical protein
MTTTYTTRGDIRGCCGHNHRTMSSAVRCLISDQAGCRLQRGYSDRFVRIIEDGEERGLTQDYPEYYDLTRNFAAG